MRVYAYARDGFEGDTRVELRIYVARIQERSWLATSFELILVAMSAEIFLQSPDWVRKRKKSFTKHDTDKDGYITREDFSLVETRLREEVNPDPELLAVYRDAVDQQCAAFGLSPGKRLDKEEYVQEMAKYCEGELARMERGEETLLKKLQDAFLDTCAADKNHDGFVTVEDYGMLWKVHGLDPHVGKLVFTQKNDKEKAGKITRKVFHEQCHDGWFTRHVRASQSKHDSTQANTERS